MPNYFINYVVLSQTPSGSQALLGILIPPLPGAEGNTPTATSLVLLTHPDSCGGSCLSSHQWVVPLSLSWISINGTPSLTLMIFQDISLNAFFLEGCSSSTYGCFVLLSFCQNNREDHFQTTGIIFLFSL